MTSIEVKTSEKKYDVVIGSGLLPMVGELTSRVISPCRALIVTDDRVHELYADVAKKAYENAGFKTDIFVSPHGEKSKNIDTYSQILEFAAEKQFTGGDIFVALGGGVVGDMAGFAAATYRRGVRIVQLPTTLLAAVDSSVGGKTAVNLDNGKNLVGAFHQPSLTVCDTDLIKTLEQRELSGGFAEIIKYGAICSEELLTSLESGEFDIENIISECIAIKAKIVSEDEYDTGKRRVLNFGHTAAHAIEKQSEYEISHGEAVAMGMYIAAKISESLGMSQPCAQRLKKVIEQCGLKAECPFLSDELLTHILEDKKRRGDELTLVLLRKIGEAVPHTIKVSDARKIFALGVE